MFESGFLTSLAGNAYDATNLGAALLCGLCALGAGKRDDDADDAAAAADERVGGNDDSDSDSYLW